MYEDIKSFLSGHNDDIKRKLKEEMISLSEAQEYERASEIKKTLDSIDHVISTQGVENSDHVSRDVFGYTSRENFISLAVLTYRRGILLGKESFILDEFGDNKEQVLDLILQYYQTHNLPKEIVINLDGVKEEIESIYDVEVASVTRGKLFEAVEMANMNAKANLDMHFMSARLNDDNNALLEELGELLNIPTPYRIELFDNSHVQGDSPVGAVVVYINGEPAKKLYRKFNINHFETRDDYASMNEVMTRRYSRLKENNDTMPDLILMDGGLGQIHAGQEVIDKLGLSIPVFGLFKNDKHQTSGIMDKDGNVYEIHNKSLFFLLVRMQDEVHRFAISFHHQKRSKNFKEGILDNIKGLGDKRKEVIRNQYPTIDALKLATVEELSQFIPPEVAELLVDKLKNL